MKKNNVKNNTIKAALILGAAIAFAAPAATMLQPQDVMAFSFNLTSSNTTTNSETYNGVTKKVTTSTVNGVTEETVEYTDENGNVMDEEAGKKAFEAAKAYCEDDEDDFKLYGASFHFDNETDIDVKELYFTGQDDDWGENWLTDEVYMAANTTVSYNENINYMIDKEFKVGIIDEEGNAHVFDDVVPGTCDDPMDVTFTFTEEDGSWIINVH